jgi:hypothetical protein
MATPPPPVKTKMPPPKAPPPQAKQTPTRPAKTFQVATWDGAGEGQKIIAYAPSGRGKTTLASMAPDPVFIGLDDGGRMVRNPITGEAINRIAGIEQFEDVRDALHQPGLFATAKTVVIDTGTVLELLAMDYVVRTIPHEKGNQVPIHRIEDYGYGKGYQHMFDVMRLIFQDLDALVRQGKNILILCQQCPIVVANPGGANFLENGPKLYHPGPESKQSFTTRGFACEWADHVLRIDYLDQRVYGARVDKEGKEHAGKATGSTQRAIFTMPADPSYFAKTRTMTDPVISFSEPKDDSLWQILFPSGYPD